MTIRGRLAASGAGEKIKLQADRAEVEQGSITAITAYENARVSSDLLTSGDLQLTIGPLTLDGVGSMGMGLSASGAKSASGASGVGEKVVMISAPLPDAVMVLPAHGAGSLCGAHLSDSPKSTIGAERASNPYFTLKGRSEFIAAVLKDLPEAPQYFKHNAAMNRQGPALVNWAAPVPAEVKAEQALMDTSKFYLVDIRDSSVYAAEHIPGSVNIGIRGRFETWVGTMVPWAMHESDKLVVLGNKAELKEALYRLHRIGYEASVLTIEAWKASKLTTKKVEFMV